MSDELCDWCKCNPPEEGKRLCTRCRQLNDLDAEYNKRRMICPNCDDELPDSIICPNCKVVRVVKDDGEKEN